MNLRLGLLLLTACGTPERTASSATCTPELPNPLRSRAKQVVCNDELIGGHATRGDWMLQSQRLTVYIRSERFALSRAGRAGGTVLDILPEEASTDVEELVPLLLLDDGSLDWFVDADISPLEDDRGAGIQVTGTLPDGTEGSLTWWLDHGDDRLQIRGATDFDVVPLANSSIRGDLLSFGDYLVSPGAVTSDTGGWFRWTDTDFLQPSTEERLPEVLPDRFTLPIHGICPDGQVLYLRDAERRILQRLTIPTASGEFELLGDNRASEIICLASSRASSGWQPLPDQDGTTDVPEDIQLSVGDFGELSVKVTDPSGNPVPATVWWNDSRAYFGLGEGTMGVGAGSGDGIVGAGPAWSTALLPALDVDEESATHAVLRRVLPESVLLANYFIEAWPHRTTRTAPGARVGSQIALGVEWAVTVGDHAVVATDVATLEQDEVWSYSGARAPTELGTITSWPWSFNRRAGQWGAPETTNLDPHEALAVMGGGRGQRTIVDAHWVTNAGPPYAWPAMPDAFHMQSLDDLPTYTALLDQYTGLALVGPLTWLDGVDRRTQPFVEADRALEMRHTIATTGPLVQLRAAGIEREDTPTTERAVRVRVMAPTWMPVDHAALLGPTGEILVEWDLGEPLDPTRLDVTHTLSEDVPWVLAMAWSDRTSPPLQAVPGWAVTSATFLDRP